MRKTRKQIQNVAVLLLLLSVQVRLLAQSTISSWYIPGPDATVGTTDFRNLLIDNLEDEANIRFLLGLSDANAVLRINVHVVQDSLGNNGVTQLDISQAIQKANITFGKIGIYFDMGVFNLIPEYEYGRTIDSINQKELFDKYLIDSTINLFLLDSVFIGNGNYYGYSFFPEGEYDAIYMRKDYVSGNALITQLGHFFGLLSTHDYLLVKELVNESNCDSTGDLICDTWADANVYQYVNDNCEYFGGTKDANGEWYVPSVANFMADSPADCKCIFTELQYRRIFYYYKRYRNYLK